MDVSETMNSRLAEAMALLKVCKASVMEEHQKKLPRLPIPSLEESLADFRRAVSPLLSVKELEELSRISESFLKVCTTCTRELFARCHVMSSKQAIGPLSLEQFAMAGCWARPAQRTSRTGPGSREQQLPGGILGGCISSPAQVFAGHLNTRVL
jgi:hypothetical protein